MLERLNTAHMLWGPWLASNLWLFKMALKTMSDFTGKLIIIKMFTWRQADYIRYSDIFRKLYVTLRMKQSNIVFWLTRNSPTTCVFSLGTFARDQGGGGRGGENLFQNLAISFPSTMLIHFGLKPVWRFISPLIMWRIKIMRWKYKLSTSSCQRKKWNKGKTKCSRLNIFSPQGGKKIGKNTLKYYFIFIRLKDYFCWIFVYPQ